MGKSFTIDKDAFPDLPQLMLVTVNALRKMGGSATIHELYETIVEDEEVTEEEQSWLMPNDRRSRLSYYLAWSRTYLKHGDALENSSRGVWALSDTGKRITNRNQTVQIRAQVLQELRSKRLKKDQPENPGHAVSRPSRSFEETDDDDENDWKSSLLGALKDMHPSAFERLSQRLLREAGFVKVEVRGRTGDGGIDGVGVLRINLISFQVYFQCKRYKGNVGAKEIRDFRGALQGRADKGLFITTGTFTSQASEEATRDGAIPIDLIDGEQLCDLLRQYELGVATTRIEKIDVKPDWFESV